MTKDMLGVLVRKIVDLPVEMLGMVYDLVEKLAGEAGQEWLVELKKFLRKKKCWTGAVEENPWVKNDNWVEEMVIREKEYHKNTLGEKIFSGIDYTPFSNFLEQSVFYKTLFSKIICQDILATLQPFYLFRVRILPSVSIFCCQ